MRYPITKHFWKRLKFKNSFVTQKKATRYRLDKQLELFNALNIQNPHDERVEKLSKKVEQLKADFNEIDVLCNLILVVMGYYEIERFEIEKYRLYSEKLSEFGKEHIHNQNEILGFFKYLINFGSISL